MKHKQVTLKETSTTEFNLVKKMEAFFPNHINTLVNQNVRQQSKMGRDTQTETDLSRSEESFLVDWLRLMLGEDLLMFGNGERRPG